MFRLAKKKIVDAEFGVNVHPDSTAARLPSKLKIFGVGSYSSPTPGSENSIA
jgi:hypothetical protein